MSDVEKKKGSALKSGKKIEKMIHPSTKPEVADLIGQKLRTFYDDIAKQPVPDRFVELLNQLEAASTRKKPS
jgi:Anti-sigma factor NepR